MRLIDNKISKNTKEKAASNKKTDDSHDDAMEMGLKKSRIEMVSLKKFLEKENFKITGEDLGDYYNDPIVYVEGNTRYPLSKVGVSIDDHGNSLILFTDPGNNLDMEEYEDRKELPKLLKSWIKEAKEENARYLKNMNKLSTGMEIEYSLGTGERYVSSNWIAATIIGKKGKTILYQDTGGKTDKLTIGLVNIKLKGKSHKETQLILSKK